MVSFFFWSRLRPKRVMIKSSETTEAPTSRKESAVEMPTPAAPMKKRIISTVARPPFTGLMMFSTIYGMIISVTLESIPGSAAMPTAPIRNVSDQTSACSSGVIHMTLRCVRRSSPE